MTATKSYWRGRPAVYRIYDKSERLIYVGQSMVVAKRLEEHRSQSWWYLLLADRVRVELHATVEAAKAAEKVAIQEERPVFNAMGYGDWRDKPYWTDADHALYAAWYAEMWAETTQWPRPARRGIAGRLAEATRRRMAASPA